MVVNRKTAMGVFVYQGEAYYFCDATCKEWFQNDPENYVKPRHPYGLKKSEALAL